MPTKTDALVRLYRIDQQIRSLTGRLKSARTYLNRIDSDLHALNTRRDALNKKQRELSALEANLENEVASIEARVTHLRTVMHSAQNHKEYSALQSELNTYKGEKDKIETQALQKLGEVDTVRAQLTEIDNEYTERAKIREVAARDVEARQQEIGDRLSELEAERTLALKTVDQSAMAIYRDFWEADEEPMAEIIEEDRRNQEYACGECNMSLPVQAVNAVLGRGDVTTCPSCRRLLYVGEELRDRFRS